MALSRSDTKAQQNAARRGNLRAQAAVSAAGGTRDSVLVTAATLLLTNTDHGGLDVLLSRAGGIAVTLPAATGSGAIFRLIVITDFTSSATIKVANASDTMIGALHTATTTTGAGTHEAAGGTDDTITLNGTTTGGLAGTVIEIRDVAATKWLVTGDLVGSGTLATPLSATV